MVRCQEFCNSGLRCKKSAPNDIGLCFTHNPGNINYCCTCNKPLVHNKKIIFDNCNHKFCKNCISNDVYNYQWFDEFSTEHPIRCTECDIPVSDNNWQDIMNYLVEDSQLLTKKIIETVYLNKIQLIGLQHCITIGKEYTDTQMYLIKKQNVKFIFDEIPSKVYFLKNNNRPRTYYYNNDVYNYTYEIDFEKLKNDNDDFKRTLMEYLFHPKRIERLGGFEF